MPLDASDRGPGSSTRETRDAKRRADVELVRSAVELYRSNNNAYPTTVTVGGDICDAGGCSATSTYLKKVPNDPKSSSYTYYYTGSSSDYTIGAYLEGGGSGSCGNCGSSASVVCNYCVGPYGEK